MTAASLADPPRAAVIQMNSGAGRDANLAVAGALLADAAQSGAALALLPENFACMGAHERDKLAIAEADGAGPIQQFLADTARRLKLWIIAGTVPLAVTGDPDRVWPACLVYDADGGRVARYDKIHLFDIDVPDVDGGGGGERYRESASIRAGAAGQAVVVDTPIGRVGLSVCYDLRFPELYRRLVDRGATASSVPSAFTERTGRAHWDALLRARAIENQCFVLAAGQHGVHASGRRTYGHSMIVDAWGETLATRADGDAAVVAPVDPAQMSAIRRTFPALTHRRLDAPSTHRC